ncbi:hypothetical protein BX600DRAFT_468811 [Xylariales sp. PMI_506]|nr:hypothetical protein BX600DRAFT_468811 [Xylariales sp. PMI_506]
MIGLRDTEAVDADNLTKRGDKEDKDKQKSGIGKEIALGLIGLRDTEAVDAAGSVAKRDDKSDKEKSGLGKAIALGLLAARALPEGVSAADVEICHEDLAGTTLSVTEFTSSSVQFENVPSTCMVVAAEYQNTSSNATIPIACGNNCLHYDNLNAAELEQLTTLFSQ